MIPRPRTSASSICSARKTPTEVIGAEQREHGNHPCGTMKTPLVVSFCMPIITGQRPPAPGRFPDSTSTAKISSQPASNSMNPTVRPACRSARWANVLLPLIASNATLALKSAENRRRLGPVGFASCSGTTPPYPRVQTMGSITLVVTVAAVWDGAWKLIEGVCGTS